MLDVSRILLSRSLAQPNGFTVWRKTGSWVNGRFGETPTSLTMHGPVMPASPKEIEQVPEGDRSKAITVFYATEPLYVTRSGTGVQPGTSDEVEWHGNRYRLVSVNDWSDHGYYKAFGVMMEGH